MSMSMSLDPDSKTCFLYCLMSLNGVSIELQVLSCTNFQAQARIAVRAALERLVMNRPCPLVLLPQALDAVEPSALAAQDVAVGFAVSFVV